MTDRNEPENHEPDYDLDPWAEHMPPPEEAQHAEADAAGAAEVDGEPELSTFEELAATVASHGGTLEAIIAYLQTTPGGPWTWNLLDEEPATKLWAELHGWVEWLDHRYLRNLSRSRYPFSARWYRHPVAVELLTALMVSHRATYHRGAHKPSSALVDWHERCLFPTLDRINQLGLFEDDDSRKGTSWQGPRPAELTNTDPEDFTAFLEQDLGSRSKKQQ
ncbi:hypothetical protein [Agromyces sp. Soil535]|uniref:hypothetical protein n=1 Tax=Agromyces sp. Soil535 TaxID=1736390 RepID=UPI0006FDCD29|nr:hypothetical protein [Agromyces sp. Soil535]KRE28254.1 hypothetical protein ASG80_21485 [Agromyces sp. Soil535]